MKLSKKSAAIQRAIHDALASGKALGGLLVGFAATVAGCGERHTPANTMGKYPSPYYQENATNENTDIVIAPRARSAADKAGAPPKPTPLARRKARVLPLEASRCL